MIGSADILTAIRELTNSKQLDRSELHGLLQDGIHAALAKKHGPNVQAEVEIDEDKRQRSASCCSRPSSRKSPTPRREVSVEEARFEDPEFQVGDMMEIPVDFAEFGRTAVQAAKQRIIQRVREGERTRIRDEFAGRVGDLLSGEIQQIERGKLVVMLNKFREAEAIIPYREQNHREHFHQGEPDSRGPQARRGDAQGAAPHPEPRRPAVRAGALQARGAGDPAGHRRDPRRRARSRQPHEDRRVLAR